MTNFFSSRLRQKVDHLMDILWAGCVNNPMDSIAARFNLRYTEQKWLDATVQLLAEDSRALQRFVAGDMTIFTASQFNQLGGVSALAQIENREQVFEALRQSSLVRQSTVANSTN